MSLSVPVKANITVEAACVLPLFVFFMAGWLIFGNALLQTISAQTELAHQVKQQAIEQSVEWWNEGGTGKLGGQMISEESRIPFSSLFSIGNSVWISRFSVRAWTGRQPGKSDGWDGEGEKEQMVYVTLHGEVYHKNPSCTHIDLSIRRIDKTHLEAARNKNGEKYRPCEECGGKEGAVYITDTGNRYHHSLECGGLKRSVVQIPLTQLEDLRPCSRCS